MVVSKRLRHNLKDNQIQSELVIMCIVLLGSPMSYLTS